MDKKTKYRLERGKEMTSSLVRIFEGSMVGLILLTILAAVTPRVSQAQSERRISLLVDRLQHVRSRISVYQAEHDGMMPGLMDDGRTITAESFITALACQDKQGNGPYLDELPANPFAETDANRTLTIVYDAEVRARYFRPQSV